MLVSLGLSSRQSQMPYWEDTTAALRRVPCGKELRPLTANINLPCEGAILKADPRVPVKPSSCPTNTLTKTSGKILSQKQLAKLLLNSWPMIPMESYMFSFVLSTPFWDNCYAAIDNDTCIFKLIYYRWMKKLQWWSKMRRCLLVLQDIWALS